MEILVGMHIEAKQLVKQGELEDVSKIKEEAEGDESWTMGGRIALGKDSRKEKINGHFLKY